MSTLLIESELDMDVAIEYIVNLSALEGKKVLTVVFPSTGLHDIFMKNLYDVLESGVAETPMNIAIEIIIRS
jgi:hypothetical protein